MLCPTTTSHYSMPDCGGLCCLRLLYFVPAYHSHSDSHPKARIFDFMGRENKQRFVQGLITELFDESVAAARKAHTIWTDDRGPCYDRPLNKRVPYHYYISALNSATPPIVPEEKSIIITNGGEVTAWGMSVYGIVSSDVANDLNNAGHSTSHKRVNCLQPLCVPEPKRQQLSSLFAELPTLDTDTKCCMKTNLLLSSTMDECFLAPPQPPIAVEKSTSLTFSNVDNVLAENELLSYNNANCFTTDEEYADDTSLLSNLPTSVDDFQAKELYLKHERHYSSPLTSRLQSPIISSTFNESGADSIFSDNINYFGSRTHSVSSNSQNAADDLDEEDLEVAMINESFEEQQKQSKIYDCMNLKSLFYGTATDCNNAVEPMVAEIVYSSESIKDTIKYFESSDSECDDDESENATPPVNMSANEFLPLLTPKSRQFVRKSSSKYMRADSPVGILSKYNPPRPSKEDPSDESENDEEKSRRLDMELEKMMLEGEEEIFPQSFESSSVIEQLQVDKKRFSETADTAPIIMTVPSHGSMQEYSDNEEAASQIAQAVAYGVVASLFASPTLDLSGMDSPSEEMQENTIEAVEEKMFQKISEEGMLRHMNDSLLSGSSGIDGCDEGYGLTDLNVNDDEKLKPDSGFYVNNSSSSGHSSWATISSNDEQKVPAIDSWEDLDDNSDIVTAKMNEVKNAIDIARMSKADQSRAEILPSIAVGSPHELSCLAHVLEAHCTSAKTESEIADVTKMLGWDSWCKKVDDHHFLLVFASASKASEALFSQRNNWIKLHLLEEACALSRTKASEWKDTLKPKSSGRRPQASATVARRMIGNALGVRVKVSQELLEKESKQLAHVKEQKRMKKEMWESN